MITANGLFDWMIQEPGPPARALYMGGAPTSMEAITHHSLEGYLGSYSALFDPARFPTAWHWTVPQERGQMPRNHYPVTARLVHGNSANVLGPGGESEGLFHEPLTQWQVECWLRIHRDLEQFTGRRYERIPGSRRGLVEHREMGPTACPSNRYAPLWAAIANGQTGQEDEVTREEYEDLLLAVFSGNEERAGTREVRLANAAYRVKLRARLEEVPEDERRPSVADMAASAAANIEDHVEEHSGPSGGLKRGDKVTLT